MTNSINSIKFTKEELKQLEALGLTINALSKLLMSKTNNEYALVARDMVRDLNNQLFNNILYGVKINESLYDSWKNFIKDNRDVADKWEKDLEDFRD